MQSQFASVITPKLRFPACLRRSLLCRHRPRHRRLRQPLLIRGLGVALDLLQRGVAGAGPDLVRGAPTLGQASGCALSQPVRRAMRKPRLVTFAPEPMVMSEHLQLAAEMMCPDTSLHADETRRQVGQPCFYLPARPLLPQHDCTTFIVPHYVKRVLADIDTDHGDSRRVKSGPTSAYSMRASAQVTAPGAVTSMIVAAALEAPASSLLRHSRATPLSGWRFMDATH